MSTPKVLVVDDEDAIRESLAEFLLDYEYVVETARSAEEALSQCRTMAFDVVIVDLRLPGISGDQLALKINKILPEARYLIHTGSVSFNHTAELEAIGIQPEHVFMKPIFDMQRLINCIEDFAGN